MGIFRMGHRWESASCPNTHASIAFKTEWDTGTHFFLIFEKSFFVSMLLYHIQISFSMRDIHAPNGISGNFFIYRYINRINPRFCHIFIKF